MFLPLFGTPWPNARIHRQVKEEAINSETHDNVGLTHIRDESYSALCGRLPRPAEEPAEWEGSQEGGRGREDDFLSVYTAVV